jgi:hypothetical protein
MDLKDFALLKKFMMMTTSSQDGEALAAIRKSNAILAKDNRNWQEVLDQVVSVSAAASGTTSAAPPGPMSKTPEEIQNALQFLLDKLQPGNTFRDFVLSLEEQFTNRAFLSQRQIEVLFKAYDRHAPKGAGWANV